MKKLLFFLFVLSFFSLKSQVTTVLVAPPYPNPEITEWESGNGDPFSFTVNNFTGVDIDVKITGTIELNGELVAFIDIAKTPTRTISPGVTVFTNPDIVPAEAISFTSISPEQIYLSGKLPAGLYTYCAELVHPLDQTSIISRSCVSFVISEQQMPILQMPLDASVIAPEMANSTIFTWTPMAPPAIAPQTLKYRFIISEIMPNQNPVQAIQGNTPIIDEELDGSVTTYPWPATLVADTGTFVWTIQSIDPNNLDNQNNPTPYGNPSQMGYSTPHVFTVGDTSGGADDLLDELIGDTLYAGENGEFKIVLRDDVTGSAGEFTGTGKVFIPMFKSWFLVKFQNIKVNSEMELAEGSVSVSRDPLAPPYPMQYYPGQEFDTLWQSMQTEEVQNYLANSSGYDLPMHWGDDLDEAGVQTSYLDDEDDNLKLVPRRILGANVKGLIEDFDLSITEIVFKPNEALINAVSSMGVPASWETLEGTNSIGFKVKNFRFHPRKIEFSKGRIEVVDDLQINLPGDKYSIIFKKPSYFNDSVRYGTFFEWDTKNDSSFFSIDLDVLFSRDVMIPVPDDNNGKVVLTMNGSSQNWNDFLLYGNLPRAEISSTNGVQIEAQDMILDISETRNHSLISFPDVYNGETSDLFKGFYLKQGFIRLPEGLKSVNQNEQISISLEDVIIDNTGFTFEVSVNNILAYPEMDMSKMSASLDTVRLAVIQNTIAYGSLKGKVTLPVSKSEISNGLAYSAVFNNGGAFDNNAFTGFNFSISPINDIKAEVWKADMALLNTSTMTLEIGVGQSKGQYGFNLALDGEITIETDLGKIKDVKLGGVRFQDLGLQYYNNSSSDPFGSTTGNGNIDNKNNNNNENPFSNAGNIGGGNNSSNNDGSVDRTPGFRFNGGTWSFASPQKEIMGFDFSVGPNGAGGAFGIEIANRTKQDGELYRGELLITGVINLTENIGGGATLGLVFAFRDDDNASEDEEGSGSGNGGITPGNVIKGSKASQAPSGGMSNYTYDVTHPEDLEFIQTTLSTTIPPTPIPPGGSGDHFRPRFIKARVDCVFVDVETQAVDILGYVKFRSDDPVYGNGFKGKVSANFKSVGLQVEAEAEFGKTKYQALTQGETYRYWRVEAGLGIPAPGIPMGPIPINIRGAGLGAYKNMTSSAAGSSGTSEGEADALNGAIQTPAAGTNTLLSGLSFKPKESGWGFMAKLRCALSEERTFNFDAGLRAEFQGTSLQQIVFRGDFWSGASIEKRNQAWLNGYLQVGYDSPHRIFNLSAQVNFSKAPIQGMIPFDLTIDGVGPADPASDELKWAVLMGTPQNPASVNVDLSQSDNNDNGDGGSINNSEDESNHDYGNVGLGVNFYLMCGNDIPYASGFTADFVNDYNAALSDMDAEESDDSPTSLASMQNMVSGELSGTEQSEIESGKGFAMGIGLKLGKPNPTFKKVFGNKVKFWYRFGAGAELNLGMYNYEGYTCDGLNFNPIGAEGWRASGNFGFWAVAGAGFQVEKFKILWKEFCAPNGCLIPLLDLGIGAWIYGEFPKPTFAAGGVDGSIKVLGVIRVKFSANFKFGQKCDLVGPNGETNLVDSKYFDEFHWSPTWSYDRRTDKDRPDIIEFKMDNKVVDASYQWINENGNVEDIIVKAVPTLNSMNWRDGAGMRTKRNGTVPNSNILFNECEHKGDYYKWGIHRLSQWSNSSSCSHNRSSRHSGLCRKGSTAQKLYLSMKFTLYKYQGNGNWVPLTFNGQQIYKNYYTPNWIVGD